MRHLFPSLSSNVSEELEEADVLRVANGSETDLAGEKENTYGGLDGSGEETKSVALYWDDLSPELASSDCSECSVQRSGEAEAESKGRKTSALFSRFEKQAHSRE